LHSLLVFFKYFTAIAAINNRFRLSKWRYRMSAAAWRNEIEKNARFRHAAHRLADQMVRGIKKNLD